MCVIVIKPKGVDIKLETLEKCWNANSDGAGVAWREKRLVVVRKGIMSFEEFEKLFKKIYSKDKEMVFHFRLTSRGMTCPEMTHPFRLVSRNEVDALEFVTNIPVLFHNGTIINLGDNEKSDTFYLSRLLGKMYFDSKVSLETLVKVLNMVGGKFVLFSPRKTIIVGAFHEENGCLFSNLSWKIDTFITCDWWLKKRRGKT